MVKAEKLSKNSYRITVCCGYDKRTGKQIRKRKTVSLSVCDLAMSY